MNDLTSIGWFLACLIATQGLLRLCGWLRPRERAAGETGAEAATKEAHR
ncbi:MAG: hypothetical protein JSR77_14670 [Planctomycetes bacterium]|nr:hypothetical protein [Planctomycetota bacterium]